MKVYFIRHGETKFNLKHILMGREIDGKLNTKGIAQAHEAAEMLDSNINLIFASPLKRAQQTAYIISDKLKVAVHSRDELAERSFGKLSGKTWDEIEQLTGSNLARIEEHFDIDLKKFEVETGSAMKIRLLHFLADLKKNYSDKTPLVVTHSGIVNLMYQLFPKTEKMETKNGTIHSFEI
jgi:broad specificity phosphatase PhoE